MSEMQLETITGEDVGIIVWFDYMPFEAQTHWNPCSPSEVTINAIYLTDPEAAQYPKELTQPVNIAHTLTAEILDDLRIECFDMVENNDEDGS